MKSIKSVASNICVPLAAPKSAQKRAPLSAAVWVLLRKALDRQCKYLATNGLDSMATFYLENGLYLSISNSAVLDDPLLFFHGLVTPEEAELRGTLGRPVSTHQCSLGLHGSSHVHSFSKHSLSAAGRRPTKVAALSKRPVSGCTQR